MADPIEFYFDFSSPYGYLAAQRIDEIGARHGRAVAWRPFLLGVVFKATGQVPLLGVPLKGDYARRDLARAARLIGVPYREPSPFPFLSVAASRAFYWLVDQDPALAVRLGREIYRRSFGEGLDMSSAAAVAEAGAAAGVERSALEAALQDPAVKDRLRREVEQAMAKGVFGSPFVIIAGEPFWGHDHLDLVDRWLGTGGW